MREMGMSYCTPEVLACPHATALVRRGRPALQTGSGLRLRAFRKRARRKSAGRAGSVCVYASSSESVPAYPVRSARLAFLIACSVCEYQLTTRLRPFGRLLHLSARMPSHHCTKLSQSAGG